VPLPEEIIPSKVSAKVDNGIFETWSAKEESNREWEPSNEGW
jgi:hypothetical protein